MPNGEFAKRMNLPKWKQFLFGLVGRKFDKMAESYGVHYHFIFVESNGQQLRSGRYFQQTSNQTVYRHRLSI